MNGGSSPFDCTDGSLADHYTSIQGLMLQFPADQQPNIAALAANNIGGNTASTSAHSAPSRYESQKRRDWNTFGQYLKNHRPPLALAKCSGAHVLEFLRYLDQFGKTKVHMQGCLYFGQPQPPAACACPLRQAWGSLDALIGRLRAAFEENGGKPESNPFGARAVRLYLREVREMQAKARGIAYEKKKRRRPPGATPPAFNSSCSTTASPLANNIMTTSAATSPPGLLQGHMLSPDRHRQASCSLPSELSYHPHLPPSLHMQLHREDGCLTPHVISQHSSLIPSDHQLPYRHHSEEISDTFPCEKEALPMILSYGV